MNVILKMLGNSLIKRDKKQAAQKKSARKKLSVEVFLRSVLGTRLLEKKF